MKRGGRGRGCLRALTGGLEEEVLFLEIFLGGRGVGDLVLGVVFID